ncbi:MAG: tetratricopeptide repeat protein [Thermoanaerobaculales bacterium]|jgi:tetratricopeptide (TPR) repeat protein|nr:tetratricopeptide repeat protein [Thermoanaerobaculales bacterium]
MAIKRDKILKTAEKLVQKGKLEQAIKEYQKLLKASPDDTNTINRLGDLYGRVGDVDRAVGLYERVAKQFSKQGFIPKAIAMYKKINRLAPQRLDIFERLGELYIEQGLQVEAKSQFKMLAEHYAKNDDMESAIRAHQRLADIDPADSGSRLKFADLLLESGDSEEAMAAYGELGDTLIRQNQIEEAERLFRRLLEREIPDGEIMVAICSRLLDDGKVTSAEELLAAGMKVSPDSIPLRTLKVRSNMALGETDAAVELAAEILEIDPDNSEVRRLVGNVLLSGGDEEEAAEMMIPAAEALLEKADYQKAQQMLRELVEIAPEDERILRLAIRAFRPSGDQEMLTRLTASLADVCYSSGQEDQAKRFYLELVASDPTNAFYRERLAELDGAVRDDADAMATSGFGDGPAGEISFAEEVVIDADAAAEPEEALDFDPAERINEAAVFAKYGLNDKAIKHLDEVVRKLPDHTEARETLAGIHLSMGNAELAAGVIRPVIESLRASGQDADAAALEERFGTSGSPPAGVDEDDDDEIIIVEIDGDEALDVGLEDVAVSEVDVDGIDIEAMVAAAPGADSPDETDSAGIEFGAFEDETAAEDVVEVVEEDLVEINAVVSGPSFNDLAQLDLFIDQELFEDAASILDRLEADFPGDPDLAERRQQLAKVDASPAVADEPPAEEPAVRAPVSEPPAAETADAIFGGDNEDGFIDLAKELEEELAEEEAMVEEATGRGKNEAMLDEVFKEFQKGVAEQLSDEDSDTHFNLGIAYKEMGLLKEAIGEFEVAAHDPTFFVEACTMIGVCATELGQLDEAGAWYQKALVAPDLTPDARTALRYELASVFERTGDVEQAVNLFAEIQNHDPDFRDVGARLAALTEQRQVN